MKRNNIIAIVSLVTILLLAVCGIILIASASTNTMYIVGVILMFTAIILCPFLELLPVFKSKKTVGECPECGLRVYQPSCICGWSEDIRQAEVEQASQEEN